MSPALACLAVAFVSGVDIGYQPAENGGLELIVQIDPITFQTLRPGDPISGVVPREAQQVRPSQITVALGESPPRRVLPANRSLQAGSTGTPTPQPDMASSAPAAAPNVSAKPLERPQVNQTSAEGPAWPAQPAITPPGAQGPVTIKPPSGKPTFPTAAEVRPQGTGELRTTSTSTATASTGGIRDEGLSPVPGGKTKAATFDGWQFVLYMAIIGLAASNGYVGWLFYDARLRYLNLLSRTFAAAE